MPPTTCLPLTLHSLIGQRLEKVKDNCYELLIVVTAEEKYIVILDFLLYFMHIHVHVGIILECIMVVLKLVMSVIMMSDNFLNDPCLLIV